MNYESTEHRESEYHEDLIFKQMANALPQIIWIARPDGFVYWYNNWYFDYTGLTPDTNWDQSDVSPIHPDDLPQLIEKWTESLKSGNQPT